MNPNHPKGRFNPYPAYKPSGVPWLGDVPGALGSATASHRRRYEGQQRR